MQLNDFSYFSGIFSSFKILSTGRQSFTDVTGIAGKTSEMTPRAIVPASLRTAMGRPFAAGMSRRNAR